MTRIKDLKIKLLLTAAYLIITALLIYFGAECILLRFVGIPCPGCGMTRAVLSAIRLDFISAFKLHPMFWSMPILYLYFLTDGKLIKNRAVNTAVFIFIAIGFLISWIIKLL